MNENRKPHVTALRTAAVLLVLVLLSISVVSGRYARYVSSDMSKDTARIAAYVFDVKDTIGHYLDLTEIQKPGDSVTYQFTVTNHNGSTSEVAEEYVLTMELRGSLPLVCGLSGGDTIVLDGMNTDVISSTGNIHTFQASVASEVQYVLTVSWPEEENDVRYSRAGFSELVLTIAAQQVD